MPAHDTTVYAKWEIRNYTITFRNYDGSVIKSDEYEYGYPLENYEYPVVDMIKEGYHFVGFDFTLPNQIPAHDIVITAQYEHNFSA